MIVQVQSPKGGTGKSLIARFALDHFISEGETPLLIETDNTNPDVARSYMHSDKTGKGCEALAINASKRTGFEILLDAVANAGQKGQSVVINCGARNAEETSAFGPALAEMCADLNLDLVTLWAMDTDRICAEQLASFLKTMGTGTRTTIIKNLGLGAETDEESFNFLSETKVGQLLPSIFFPALPESVTALLKSPSCRAIHELDEAMGMGPRYLSKGSIRKAKDAVANAMQMAKIKE